MIDSARVGMALPTREARLTVRRLLAYAAGVGDTTNAVFDDTSPGFMAHPALCVALEWPVISDPTAAAALVSDPAERLRAVHLVQDSTFHRPLRAGDALSTSGSVTGIWAGAAGARVASTLLTVDSTGAAAVTSRTVAVYRGVVVQGPDRPPAEDAPVPPPAAIGTESFESRTMVGAAQPHHYTECSGIWNPIHTEKRVARAAGLPDIVLHGTATWAWAASALVQGLAEGNPARLERLRARFAALVMPGMELTLKAAVTRTPEVQEVHFRVHTPSRESAIADGYARLRVRGP